MGYSLYLDDERSPKTYRKFFIVRNYEDFVYTIATHGIPEYISFDHDLGRTATGYDCAVWLTGYVMGYGHDLPDNFQYNVHSANPVGAKNITMAMERLIKLRKKGSKDD